jgi:signal transduction histidine kinase
MAEGPLLVTGHWPLVTAHGRSLRARVALGVALPVLLALVALSLLSYWRERNLLENQLHSTASQLGEVMAGGLRQAMLTHDGPMLAGVLQDVAEMEAIDRVRIVDAQGVVRFDTAAAEVDQQQTTLAPGCTECHIYPPATRPRAVRLASPAGILRIATPITNDSACTGCHGAGQAHLGVVLADVPLQVFQSDLVRDLSLDLALSGSVALLVSLGIYGLTNRLIVRRLEAMQAPLSALGHGDLSVRLPEPPAQGDEIDNLAAAFNAMAGALARGAQAEAERRESRERAIRDERQRIARELHDGLAQILGYVNTKAMAVRLYLANAQPDAARQQLEQLEQAARQVLLDARQAILGLRLTADAQVDFPAALRGTAAHFSQLSGLAVHVDIPPETEHVRLAVGAELELLRIVQEALSNIRKHAAVEAARVELRLTGDDLEVSVADEGAGFDTEEGASEGSEHFGLESMRQRARAIGADLTVASEPGGGTRVTVRLTSGEGE